MLFTVRYTAEGWRIFKGEWDMCGASTAAVAEETARLLNTLRGGNG